MSALYDNGLSSAWQTPHLRRTSDWLVRTILPLGWLALLTGLFWIGDRSYYHKLYYASLAFPTFLAALMNPHRLKPLLGSPLLITFLIFSCYTLITLLWSITEKSSGSLIKRPIYVLLLFISAGLLAIHTPERLLLSVRISSWIASLAALASLYIFFNGPQDRLSGYGALYNALLSSHVFGSFMALWMANWVLSKNKYNPASLISLAILGTLVVATGSRTPLLGLTACGIWLMAVTHNRRSFTLLTAGSLTIVLLLFIHPEALISRGLSSRPDIWQKAWLQVQNAPWLGHGYDAPLKIWISAHDFAMADPHNILLAVLYYCGGIGLSLWLLLYGLAFSFAWRNRRDPLTVIVSSMLVFGFAASMTEGGAFLSRPKEHWFLIWIPLALIFAIEIKKKTEKRSNELVEKA